MSGLLLVGGATASPSSLDITREALQQARLRGLRTVVLARPEHLAASAAVVGEADETVALDAHDPMVVSEWARRREASGDRYDIVLGLRDDVLEATAVCAEVFGVRGNSPATVRRTQDKDSCRAALAAAGLRQPRVRLCRGREDAFAALTGAGPWVVKPRSGSGSAGVRLVREIVELEDALRELSGNEMFLVEDFVDGEEFSVEGVMLADGPLVLALTAKEKFPPPHFVEAGHVVPADLPPHLAEHIVRDVGRALQALEVCTGVFHVEVWTAGSQVVLGEVHARPGGDWIHLLIAHARPGLELFGMLYDDLLGRPAAAVPPLTRAAAVRFLAPPAGRLQQVHGWSAVSARADVLNCGLTVRPGARLGPVSSSGGRAGHVAVGADTPQQARALAAEIGPSVTFVMEPAQ